MNENQFWAIINESIVGYEKDPYDTDLISINLHHKLIQYDYNSIVAFQKILQKKMRDLDNCKSRSVSIIFKGYEIGERYLDFRCWIICRGKIFYDKFMADPESVAEILLEDFNFNSLSMENLMYAADSAFEDKYPNSEELKSPRELVTESYTKSDKEFDDDCFINDERLSKYYPKLWNGYSKIIGRIGR
jgi:hypothetical protein